MPTLSLFFDDTVGIFYGTDETHCQKRQIKI